MMIKFTNVNGLPVYINKDAILAVLPSDIKDAKMRPYAKVIIPTDSVILNSYVEDVIERLESEDK